MFWPKKYSNSPLLWCFLRDQEDGGFARAGLRLFTSKALADWTAGTPLSRRRHLYMSANDSHESITRSASPKKNRIILVPKLLKEAPLQYPSTTAVGIFAIHLTVPSFSAAVSCPWRGSKLKSKLLSWSCQAGFLAVTYRARCHYFSERYKGRKLSN